MKTLFRFGLACTCAAAFAGPQGSAANVKVTGVDARIGGIFLVAFTPAALTTPAACATATDFRMTGTTTTADGKALYAAAMTAFVTGTPVALIQGTGTCNEYQTHESIAMLSLGVE